MLKCLQYNINTEIEIRPSEVRLVRVDASAYGLGNRKRRPCRSSTTPSRRISATTLDPIVEPSVTRWPSMIAMRALGLSAQTCMLNFSGGNAARSEGSSIANVGRSSTGTSAATAAGMAGGVANGNGGGVAISRTEVVLEGARAIGAVGAGATSIGAGVIAVLTGATTGAGDAGATTTSAGNGIGRNHHAKITATINVAAISHGHAEGRRCAGAVCVGTGVNKPGVCPRRRSASDLRRASRINDISERSRITQPCPERQQRQQRGSSKKPWPPAP